MKSKQDKFSIVAFRYSILHTSPQEKGQITIDPKGSSITKEDAFRNILEEVFVKNNKTTSCIDEGKVIYKTLFKHKPSHDDYVFQFAKETTKEIFEETDDGFSAKSIDSYPNTVVALNIPSQICFIEPTSSFSNNVTTIANAFSKCISSQLKHSGYPFRVKMEAMTSTHDFWEIAQAHEGEIKELEFHLLSPNFLGANYEAREVLNTIKEETGTEETTIKFKNSDGNLKISGKTVTEAVKWIASGCGRWSITTKGKTYKSENTPISTSIKDDLRTQKKEDAYDTIKAALAILEDIENENKNTQSD